MTLAIHHLDSSAADFDAALDALVRWDVAEDAAVAARARRIVDDVRERGDRALLEHTLSFDDLSARSVAELELSPQERRDALASLPEADRAALEQSAARIRDFHERQLSTGMEYRDALGNRLGVRITPIDRVGVYVPGGQAAYPSSVLMTVIPARVAGVREVIVTVPTPKGRRNALVLAALEIAGVDRAFTVGGAQAIAALAFGTETMPRVDKIVGPGGSYVAAAKRLVFGPVGIESIAGPSEILIVADGTVDPEWVALDLFSQAEHDEAAQAILLCPIPEYVARVEAAMARLIHGAARARVIRSSLASRGALIRTRDLAEAIEIANGIAPEHLVLAVSDPDALLPGVRHAGAVFLGALSSETLGDYVAGPSHVLPTFGTARFASALGVQDFQKRSSIIGISRRGAEHLGRIAAVIARGEGLDAHARAALARLDGIDHNLHERE
jgi:histidinol dehydrogenase